MTRRTLQQCLIGLAVTLFSSALFAGGNANFIYGTRSMDDDAWEPTEDQEVNNLSVDFGGNDWPVSIAIGYLESGDEGTLASFPILGPVDLDSRLSEWDVGVRKIWTVKRVRPFVGGGVALIEADADVESALGTADDSDDTEGLYVEGGVYWRLGEAFNLGLSGRLLEGTDVTLFDVDGDADNWQVGALLGFGWK